MSTENSLAHTKWECKYHVVFAPKYRRQVIYKDIRADIGQSLGDRYHEVPAERKRDLNTILMSKGKC